MKLNGKTPEDTGSIPEGHIGGRSRQT